MNDWNGLLNLAILSYRKGQLLEAIKQLKEIIDSWEDPKPIVYQLLIDILLQVKDWEQAAFYAVQAYKVFGEKQFLKIALDLFLKMKNYEKIKELLNELEDDSLAIYRYYLLKEENASDYELKTFLEKYKENNDPEILYELAKLEYEAANYEEAINLLKQAIKMAKKLDYFLFLADIYVEIDEYDEAIKLLWNAERFFPKQVEVFNKLSDLYYRKENLDESIRILQRAIDSGNVNEKLLNKLAIFYRLKNDKETALKFLNEALKLNQNYFLTYYNLGRISMLEEDWEKAKLYFEKAKLLNPRDIYTLNALAYCYAKLGQTAKAIKEYKEAIKLDEKDYYAYIALAKLFSDVGREEEAQILLEEGLKLTKNNKLLYQLAEVNKRLNRLQEAKNYYSKILILDKNDYKAHYNLGLIYMLEGDIDLAILEYNIALKLSGGKDKYIVNALAEALIEKKDYVEALSLLEKLEEKDDVSYNLLGLIFLANKEIDQAIEYFNKALSINEREEYKLNLAIALQMKGEVEEAKEILEKLIENGYKTAEVKYNLGKIALKEGNYVEALKNFHEAWKLDRFDTYVMEKIANVYIRMRRYEDANLILNKALNVRPDDPILWLDKAKVAIGMERYDLAKQCVDKVELLTDDEDIIGKISELKKEIENASS